MGGSPKPPPAPDPIQTAYAQSGMNRDTAITQQTVNMVNQVGPEGSLTYNKTGEEALRDSLTGNYYTVPRYTATTTLTPQAQNIYNIGQQTQENIANIGQEQSKKIRDLLGTPLKIGNEATEKRLFALGSKRLNPQFGQQEEALRTRLVNQGLRPGTQAWDAEFERFDQGKNDAFNQLLLTGRGQAVQEQMAERSTPINEITALQSGSQVSQPNFVNTPQTQVAGTDYQGAVRDSYNAQMQGYQARVGQQNAMMGGLFGLAGTLGGAWLRGPRGIA